MAHPTLGDVNYGMSIAVVWGIILSALGLSVFVAWWTGPVFLLLLSFIGGIVQFVKERKHHQDHWKAQQRYDAFHSPGRNPFRKE